MEGNLVAMGTVPEEFDWKPIEDWFGFRHDMHDAELLGIELGQNPPVANVRIHAWRMTPELDEKGYYVRDRFALVIFRVEGIQEVGMGNGSWDRLAILDQVECRAEGHLCRLFLQSVIDGTYCDFLARQVTVSVSPIQQ